MKAKFWIYSTRIYEAYPFFCKEVDSKYLRCEDASEAVSCEFDIDGSLPVEEEELKIGLDKFLGKTIDACVVKVDHPIFLENGQVVCKTFVHAFTIPESFERLKSAQ